MYKKVVAVFILLLGVLFCNKYLKVLSIEVYQTSASGDQLTLKENSESNSIAEDTLELFPNKKFQTITGFGGSFTESATHLLTKLSGDKQAEVINAYFIVFKIFLRVYFWMPVS